MTGRYFFSVILLIYVATAAAQQNCKYSLYTKTGSQAANATSGAQVDFYIGYSLENARVISNICNHSAIPVPECFRSDTVDAFFFFGPCDRYCEMAFVFSGSDANSWNLDQFILRASLTTTPCEFTKKFLDDETYLNGPNDTYEFDFCDEAGKTKKQKLTEASRLRLFGKPSYTT